MGHVLANRRFLVFALIHCTCLIAYNQFYLAIPVELDRIGVPGADITWLFGMAAVLTVALQLPVTRMVAHWSTARVLGWGYALMAAGLLGVAAFAALPPPARDAGLPALGAVRDRAPYRASEFLYVSLIFSFFLIRIFLF